MKTNVLACLAVAALLTVTGCATKQYPQAPQVTPEESSAFTCEDIEKEIVKTKSIKEEIERTGGFDGRTVLGFLGDFGIGNGMAKSTARGKVDDRMKQLESLRQTKRGGPLFQTVWRQV